MVNRRLMQLLYTVLLYLIQPLVWLRLLLRSRKAPAYRKRWAERYGFCTGKVKPQGILLHAVSVGETVAAIPLVKELQAQYPDLPITITTMTPTGSERVTAAFGDSVSHVYLPYDLPCALARFLDTVQPKLMIIMETELWPNLITQLYKKHVPLIIANARLSEHSANGYLKFSQSMKPIMQKITLIAAQNQQDGQRFLKLGLPEDHLAITGSIKFDIDLTPEQHRQIQTLRQQWNLNRSVWIAASTHAGEDEIILAAFKQLLVEHPDLLLILVPRHPERFKQVEKLVASQGLSYQLRSEQTIPTATTQVLIGDTMGELMLLYGLADIAFVGGSLIERGGHNPLEPALHRLPIVMGKHYFNFRAICKQLIDAEGLIITESDDNNLHNKINKLLKSSQHRINLGQSAYLVLKENQGALQHLLALIKRYL